MFGGFQHGKEVRLLGCPVRFRDADVTDKGISLEQLGTRKTVLLPDIGVDIGTDAESQFPRLPLDGDEHLLQQPSFRASPFCSQTQVRYAAEVNGNIWLISEMALDQLDRGKCIGRSIDHLVEKNPPALVRRPLPCCPQFGVFAGETLWQRMEDDKGVGSSIPTMCAMAWGWPVRFALARPFVAPCPCR